MLSGIEIFIFFVSDHLKSKLTVVILQQMVMESGEENQTCVKSHHTKRRTGAILLYKYIETRSFL